MRKTNLPSNSPALVKISLTIFYLLISSTSFPRFCFAFHSVALTSTFSSIAYYRRQQHQQRPSCLFQIRFNLGSEDDDDDSNEIISPSSISFTLDGQKDGDFPPSISFEADGYETLQQQQNTNNAGSIQAAELATLVPGQILSVRIGNVSQSRKAWKKRRRSKSPILVPCTILGMEREEMVKRNLVTLLWKFGKQKKKQIDNDAVGGMWKTISTSNEGVKLGLTACVKLYERTFGSSLLEHIDILGHSDITSYFKSTFDEYFYTECGVKFVHESLHTQDINEDDQQQPQSEEQQYLYTTKSLRRAREAVSKTTWLQFLADPDTPETMFHTGATVSYDTFKTYRPMASKMMQRPVQLSAAVRLTSQNDLQGIHGDNDDKVEPRIQSGMYCRVFTQSYQSQGDNGQPLLLCSIDTPKAQLHEVEKRRHSAKRREAWEERNDIRREILARRTNNNKKKQQERDRDLYENDGNYEMRNFDELKVGDGPIKASVVELSARDGAAFVDFGVKRKRGKSVGGGAVRILGALPLDDVVMNLHLQHTETADNEMDEEEVVAVEQVEEGYGEDSFYKEGEEMDSNSIVMEEDVFAGFPVEEHLRTIGQVLESESSTTSNNNNDDASSSSSSFLSVGDEVDVYVRGVFPQSGRFVVTLDPSIRGQKWKEMKKKKNANKRLTRLAAKVQKGREGEEESLLSSIANLIGTERCGTVKAKSKVGNWYYVQPDDDNEEVTGKPSAGWKLPVGVAQGEQFEQVLKPGDRVQIRLEGIDESRGQLAMKLMKTLKC